MGYGKNSGDLKIGTTATDAAAGNKGVTNGDNHNHTGGAGATIPIAGGGTGATTAAAALTALGGVAGGWNTILNKTFGNSESQGDLEAEGFVFTTGAGDSIVDGASHLTVTANSGSSRDWYNTDRSAPNISYPLRWDAGGIILMYTSVRTDAVDNTGGAMVLHWDISGNDWYQLAAYRTSSTYSRQVLRSPTTQDYGAADGALEVWLGYIIIGSYYYPISKAQSWASGAPGVDDWDILVSAGRSLPTLRTSLFHVRLLGKSFSAYPGSTIDYGQLTIQTKVID